MRSVPLLAAAKLLPLLRLCLGLTASLRAPLVALPLCPSVVGWPLCAPMGPSRLVLSPAAGAAPRGSPSARLHRAKDRDDAQALWLSRHVVRAKRARGVREASIRHSVAEAQPQHGNPTTHAIRRSPTGWTRARRACNLQ